MPRDMTGEKEEFLERRAICTEDGGVPEQEALRIADRQLWATIDAKSKPSPEALKKSAKWIPAAPR